VIKKKKGKRKCRRKERRLCRRVQLSRKNNFKINIQPIKRDLTTNKSFQKILKRETTKVCGKGESNKDCRKREREDSRIREKEFRLNALKQCKCKSKTQSKCKNDSKRCKRRLNRCRRRCLRKACRARATSECSKLTKGKKKM